MPDTRKSNTETNIPQLLEKLENKIDTLVDLPSKFDTMNALVKDLATKLDLQISAVSALKNEINDLAKKNNDHEQRSRDHCIRIWGLKHNIADLLSTHLDSTTYARW